MADFATITFHPQAWVRGYAVDVDPEGPVSFRVPLADVEGMKDNTDGSDALARHPNAPHWIQEWSGTYYITIERR